MQKLTNEFNKVVVKKGESFCIELPSNPTAGYTWDLQLKQGKASLVKQDFAHDVWWGAVTYGAGGTETFVFKAEETGVIEIEGQYGRNADKKPPVKSQSFSVTVK